MKKTVLVAIASFIIVVFPFTILDAAIVEEDWENNPEEFRYGIDKNGGLFVMSPVYLQPNHHDMEVYYHAPSQGSSANYDDIALGNLIEFSPDPDTVPGEIQMNAMAKGPDLGVNTPDSLMVQAYAEIIPIALDAQHGVDIEQEVGAWVSHRFTVDTDELYSIQAYLDAPIYFNDYNNSNFDQATYDIKGEIILEQLVISGGQVVDIIPVPGFPVELQSTSSERIDADLYVQDGQGRDVTYQIKIVLSLETRIINVNYQQGGAVTNTIAGRFELGTAENPVELGLLLTACNDADADDLCSIDDNCPLVWNPNQEDLDGDDIGDACDVCPEDPDNDADGDGVCVPDDLCPNDPNKTAPGACGCGTADTDTDGDMIPDCIEAGTCTDPSDSDTDDDGIPDGVEDANQDGVVDPDETDPCDTDTDGDGIQDGTESGYTLGDIGPDTDQLIFEPDLDPQTTTDPLDEDSDGDGFLDGDEDINLNGRIDAGEADPNDPNSMPATVSIIGGLGTYPTDGGWIEAFSSDYAPAGWIHFKWPDYNAANGEMRTTTGDIDGDGRDEIVVGLGPFPGNPSIPGGWFGVFDDDYTHLAWGRVSWSAYNSENGETWPACGDLDGDGTDEIVIGLGTYTSNGGWFEVFAYDSGSITHQAWQRVRWINYEYNSANGEARPACGDIDGDGRDEIVVGLGPVPGDPALPGGWFEIFDDDLSHLDWGMIEWTDYNNTNGETWPACGDVDGDGTDEIVVGLGSYPANGGWFEVFEYAPGSVTSKAWENVSWRDYNLLNGETRPTCGDIDDDGLDEVIIGLGIGGDGYMKVLDDDSAGYITIAWPSINWSAYSSANGETRPAVQVK